MDVDTLNTLMVTRWGMMAHEQWASVQRHLAGRRDCRAYLDHLMATPSPIWTAACQRQQITPFLRDRLERDDYHDLVVNDRYVIFDRIGRGGYGTTFLAFDRLRLDEVEPVVVVKVTDIRPGDRLYSRLKAEYTLLNGITSRYFPRVKHFDGGNGRFVMQYFRGTPVDQLINRATVGGRRLKYKLCLDLARQLAEALGNIHRSTLVHRDIKPANLIVRELTDPPRRFGSIVDWGLAKEVGTSLGTRAVFMGTPYFAAPECQSDPAGATAASDVYSLACVVFNLFVGEPPLFQYYMEPHTFNARGESEFYRRRELHQPDHRPRISHFRRNVPPELDDAVFHAMAWEPGDRRIVHPGHADHLLDDGDRLLAALGAVPNTHPECAGSAPARVQHARLLAQQAYRESCRERDLTFASDHNIGRVIDQVNRCREMLELSDVVECARSHPDPSAAALHSNIVARLTQVASRYRYATLLGGNTRADNLYRMNAILDAIRETNENAMKLFHVLCDRPAAS
jgi:serine/threonine protein kinase